MRKIIDYITVSDPLKEDLDKEVCELIKEGWQPYGSQHSTQTQLVQPMVKYEEQKIDKGNY